MIYFIRHGETEANERKVFAGQKDDSILTKKGRVQARAIAREIIEGGIKIDRMIASPMARTMETAHIVAQELGFDISRITKDERIIEYDLGSLSGTPWSPIINLIEAEGTEDPDIFKDRILSCINEIKEFPGNTLLVSHGIVARMLKTIKAGNDPKSFNEMPTLTNASILEIDWIK